MKKQLDFIPSATTIFMIKWKLPPKIKIYEALGCLADGRLKEINSQIRVYSSSGNKYYNVTYDQSKQAIMANDNGSYWQGYLGYPAIAYLMSVEELPFDQKFAEGFPSLSFSNFQKMF